VRKGSVAAFVANVKLLGTLTPGTAEHTEVGEQIRALAPAVATAGVFDVLAPRSPEIGELIGEIWSDAWDA
jgi:hypothetical protein